MFSVIFDMDGTLFDTQRIFIPAWDYAGQKQGFDNMGRFVPHVCGTNEKGCVAYLEKNFLGLDVKKFRADARDYVVKNIVVEFKPGVKDLIDYLKSRGVKMAVATGSSRASTEHHLKETGIFEDMTALVCGPEIENGKPAPDIFLKTAELMGVSPAECFVFEDSENGIIAGYNAGMKSIGVADVKPFSPEVKKLMFCELENIAEAIELFERM